MEAKPNTLKSIVVFSWNADMMLFAWREIVKRYGIDRLSYAGA